VSSIEQAEFERTPPHDIAAEQCVLGGMMLSKDAISDVIEVIRATDHYRPAHQIVHETILDLYGRGEPADAVTVSAELTKRGDIGKVGGAPYLHTLIASVPTAANAGYYARIVRERAILRRLVEVGTRIVQLGYAGDADADELVDRAQAEVYAVTERRASDDYLPLSDIMPGALVEIEAIGSRGGGLTGVPTGFADLDALTNGLHPGQMIVIAARPALGKALALDTPLPTPAGWTTMGEVAAGDLLIGANGQPVAVAAVTGVLHDRPCYAVEFSDGQVIVADGQHQWLTCGGAARRSASRRRTSSSLPGRPVSRSLPEVLTTERIAATLRVAAGGRRSSHAVPLAGVLELPEQTLPVPPYALGAWLGAGSDRVGQPQDGRGQVDPEISLLMADRDDHALCQELEALGVTHKGRIPARYLRAGSGQRRALLAGLLDASGTVSGAGAIEISIASQELADDVRELALGLGYHAAPGSADGSGRFNVSFRAHDQVFGVSSKQRLHKERLVPGSRPVRWRYIVAVRPVPSRPVRCVQVTSADKLYLAGRAMIPTHNSTLALDLARAASIKHGLASVIFSLEMSRNEITMRLLSAEARVALHSMRTGQMSDEDWTRLARRMSEVAHAPMFIDDSPNMSMMEIRAKCRRLKQRHDLRLVIIDYLQLMTSPKRVENRQQEVSDLSRSLKLLAKELDVPVIAVAQLNRGPEQRTDKRPLLADLRESGSIEQDADMVILLHREDAYERESPRAGEADFIVAKHRNGPTATVTVAFQGHYSRFVDMARI
jgi:replicative DNA helicase